MKQKGLLCLIFLISGLFNPLWAQIQDTLKTDSLKADTIIIDTLKTDSLITDSLANMPRTDTVKQDSTVQAVSGIDTTFAAKDTIKPKQPPQPPQPAINPPIEIYQTFGQLYDRIEISKGYMTPIPKEPNTEYFGYPSIYNSVRSRFGLDYYLRDRFTFRITFQSVKYFGTVPDIYYLHATLSQPLYEAWTEYYLSPDFSIKAGIMPLSFDNERIMGERDWLPQAASHNALVLHYDDIVETYVGVAYDFNNPLDMVGTIYDRSYKIMQFAWLGGYIGSMDISLLALNTFSPEVKYIYSPSQNTLEPVDYNLVALQTFGFYSNIGTKPVYVEAEFYYQLGRYPHDWVLSDSLVAANITLDELNRNFGTNLLDGPGLGKFKNAFMFSLSATYESKLLDAKLGIDYLCGDNYLEIGTDDNNLDNAFDPALGSNHNFYGAMDYFYMNSWAAGYGRFSPGLKDFYANLTYKGKRVHLNIAGHYFQPQGTVYYPQPAGGGNYEPVLIKELGYELDIKADYYVVPEVAALSFGFAALKPTDGLLYLKDFDPALRRNLYHTFYISFKLNTTFYKAFKYKHKLVQEFSTSEKIE